MSKLSIVKDTLGIVNTAAEILKSDPAKKAGRAIAAGVGAIDHVNGVGGALTQLTAQTMIISRVFIDAAVLDEPVLPNLMKSIHEWYAAQVIAALQLSQMVDGKRSVEQVMSVLQTGQNDRTSSMIRNLSREASIGVQELNRRYNAQESFLSNYGDPVALESFVPTGTDELRDLRGKNKDLEKENETLRGGYKNASVRSVNVSEHRIGPMGELYEVTLTNPNDKNLSIKVPVFVQMQPTIVDADAAPRFIDMNVPAPLWQRWTQMRAGELSFWHDFIWQRDNILRLKAISKDPATSKAFHEFQRTIARKNIYALGDLTDRSANGRSSNLANSVVIFTEDSVARAKSDSGIDLHNAGDRQRYFRNIYAMIVVIVDPLHQRLTIYFNGIDGALECAYSEFKPKDAKFDPKDFMQALTAFQTNSIGRMR